MGQHYPCTFGIAPDHRAKWQTHAVVSCSQCEGLSESRSIDKPGEYLEFARRLLRAVDDGRMTLAASTCPLQDLFNQEWPADVVEHNFRCNACGRSFQLFADTFHGHAGWGLTGPPTKEPAPEQSTSAPVTVLHCQW